MRIFFLTGLMAATMLTPAAASAAEIAPELDMTANPIQVDLTGTAAQQRDRRSERRANRGNGERRAQRAQNGNNRGQARLETRGDRAEARQNRRVDNVDRRVDHNVNRDRAPRVARQAARPDRATNRTVTRDRQVARERNVTRPVTQSRRVAQQRDIRRGDRNRDGRVDRRWDRNRDGRIDRRYDRNDNSRVDRRYDRNRDGRVDRRYRDNRSHARSHRDWNRSWRQDRRYDWQRYRQANRSYYRLGRYYSPYRSHSYRRWNIGVFLGTSFYGSRYWINDPWRYRLPAAYGGTRWIRYYDDVLLVDTYTGEVIDVIYDFFW